MPYALQRSDRHVSEASFHACESQPIRVTWNTKCKPINLSVNLCTSVCRDKPAASAPHPVWRDDPGKGQRPGGLCVRLRQTRPCPPLCTPKGQFRCQITKPTGTDTYRLPPTGARHTAVSPTDANRRRPEGYGVSIPALLPTPIGGPGRGLSCARETIAAAIVIPSGPTPGKGALIARRFPKSRLSRLAPSPSPSRGHGPEVQQACLGRKQVAVFTKPPTPGRGQPNVDDDSMIPTAYTQRMAIMWGLDIERARCGRQPTAARGRAPEGTTLKIARCGSLPRRCKGLGQRRDHFLPMSFEHSERAR